MNIDLKVVLEKLTNFFSAKKAVSSHAIANPARDWKIILSCVAVSMVLAGFFGGYMYYEVVGSQLDTVNSAGLSHDNSIADIQTIVGALEKRAQSHRGYEQGEGGMTDPSR